MIASRAPVKDQDPNMLGTAQACIIKTDPFPNELTFTVNKPLPQNVQPVLEPSHIPENALIASFIAYEVPEICLLSIGLFVNCTQVPRSLDPMMLGVYLN